MTTPRSVNRLGLVPAILVAGLAFSVLGTAGYAVYSSEQDPPAEEVAEAAPAPAPPAPELLNTPAADVIRAVLGEETTQWTALAPVPFGCAAPAFVLSATTTTGGGTVGMHVVGAGQGRATLDALASCGWRTTVAGAPGLKFSFATGESVMWMRGDVLISLASGDVSAAALEALDAQVMEHLAPLCVSLDPSSADAARSPVNPAYTQLTAPSTVAISAVDLPNADPAAVPVLADLPQMSLPVGVIGPDLPAAVDKPEPPVAPGPQVVSAEVTIPVLDAQGPGCGWAFTGTLPPNVTQDEVDTEVARINTEKSGELTAAQSQWKADTEAFTLALGEFAPAADAWNVYADQTAQVHTSWANQRLALDVYEEAKRNWDAAVLAKAELIDAQATAQQTYDDQVAQCAALPPLPEPTPEPVPDPTPEPEPTTEPTPDPTVEPSPTPTPAPSPTPSPSPSPSATVNTVSLTMDTLVCPVPRPSVLDRVVVEPGDEPVPPVLWPNS